MHCDGHCQPQPLCPLGVGHLRVLPAPSSAFVIFVLVFNPETHLIPRCLRLLFFQIRHHRQLLRVAFFPPNQQRSFHPLPLLTPFSLPLPTPPSSLHPHPYRAELPLASCADSQPLFDPQQGMPPLRDNGLIEPGCVESSVCHHDDLPLLWHHAR